jgi:hypothetical protein
MTNNGISRLAFPLLTMAFTLSVAACSSDDTGTAATGGAPGAGGVPAASGGAAASGGTPVGSGGVATGGVGTGGVATGGTAAGTGGAGTGGVPLPEPYVCSTRAPTDPGVTGASGDGCCGGVGKCADPATLTGDSAKSYGHDTCGPALKCAPPAPTSAPATCTTKVGTSVPDGLEGRCVPKCFLLGNPLAGLLDDGGTCPAAQSCAPCFNPVDGKSTGACNTGTDAPVKPAPAPYVACPAGNDTGQEKGGGLCVPESVVNKLSDKANPLYNPAIPGLLQDNCATGEKCVPALKAANPGYCSVHCTTSDTLRSINKDQFGPGACTPQYVIWDTNGSSGVQIVSGTGTTACGTGELCAPCANPLTGGSPSGACY